MTDKEQELLNDVTKDCGYYVMGDDCFSKDGEYTHQASEEHID